MVVDEQTVQPAAMLESKRPSQISKRVPAAWRLAGPAFLVLLACISVLAWGKLDQLYASGDLFPSTVLAPARWLPAAMEVWTSSLTVAGNLNYEGTYLLSSALEWLPRTLGVSAAVTQRAEFALLTAGTLLAAFGLPVELGITESVLPRLLGAIAFVFSLAFFMHTGDLLMATVFLLVVLLPLLYGRFLRAAGRKALALGAGFVVTAQLVAYLYINPPQAVVVTVQVTLTFLYLLLRQSERWRAVRKTIPLLLVTMAASVWWVVPAYIATFNPALQFVAVTNVTDWAWTQVRSSLLNTWSLIPNWGWVYREYFPYNSYYQPRLVQITQLWPLFVVNLALLATRRKTGLAFAPVLLLSVAAIIAAFLVKGVHPPMTAANLLLYQHVPGFFLFREPTSKFSEPMMLAVALLLVWLLAQAERIRWQRRALWPAVVGLAGLTLGIVGWPAFSGMVTMPPPAQPHVLDDGPMVTIPSYWYQMAAYLNERPDDGGYALLPNDDYYAQQYSWGFYGSDQLPGSLIARPALYLYDTPQSYTSATAARDALVGQLVAGLHKGDTAQMARQLGLLGVRYVLLRKDVTTADLPGRQAIPPAQLKPLLERTPGLRLIHTVGALDLYEIDATLVRPNAYARRASATRVSATPTLDTLTAAAAADTTLVSAPPPCAVPSVPETAPTVTILGSGLDTYTVKVTASQAPVLLVLNQSYNPDWQLTLPRQGEQAGPCSAPRHVVVNGYANGWWISAPGTGVVQVAFAPQRRVNVAMLVSAVVLAGTLLTLVVLGCLATIGRRRSRAHGNGKA